MVHLAKSPHKSLPVLAPLDRVGWLGRQNYDLQEWFAAHGRWRNYAAGKAIYTEKPTAESVDEALELARLADDAGVKTGVVHDKLYLPGLQKLKRLIDSGFFGEILSVRGEFGYWVFEGDWQPAQRPNPARQTAQAAADPTSFRGVSGVHLHQALQGLRRR